MIPKRKRLGARNAVRSKETTLRNVCSLCHAATEKMPCANTAPLPKQEIQHAFIQAWKMLTCQRECFASPLSQNDKSLQHPFTNAGTRHCANLPEKILRAGSVPKRQDPAKCVLGTCKTLRLPGKETSLFRPCSRNQHPAKCIWSPATRISSCRASKMHRASSFHPPFNMRNVLFITCKFPRCMCLTKLSMSML